MRSTRRTGKLTREEVARAIEREGRLEVFKSGSFLKYYQAFGQRWKITYSTMGSVKSIEQVREDGTPVRLG